MLRFYFKRVGDVYRAVSNPNGLIKSQYSSEELSNITSKFCEVIFVYSGANMIAIKKINELDVDFINHEAIKAANDNNFHAIYEPNSRHDGKITLNEMREKFMEIVDRTELYETEFYTELNKLLDRFPVSVTNVPVKMGENTFLSFRKTSKPENKKLRIA